MRKNETTKKCRFQSIQKNAEHQKASHFNFLFLMPQSLLLIPYFPLSISHSTFPISHFSFFILHSCDILFIEAKTGDVMSSYARDSPFSMPHSSSPFHIFRFSTIPAGLSRYPLLICYSLVFMTFEDVIAV